MWSTFNFFFHFTINTHLSLSISCRTFFYKNTLYGGNVIKTSKMSRGINTVAWMFCMWILGMKAKHCIEHVK